VIVCRSDRPVPEDIAAKVALFCDVDARAVVPLMTVDTIYRVPLLLEDAGLGDYIVNRLSLTAGPPDLADWRAIVDRLTNPRGRVSIAVVGKYVELPDAYLSVKEALIHAGIHHGVEVDINWIQAAELETADVPAILAGFDGIVVPGGFGERGLEGKILAAQYAREQHVPYLGLCLGLQMMVIEFARNVLGWEDAHTTEVDPETGHPVISLLSEQLGIEDLGGTMRLGGYPCRIVPGTCAAAAYGEEQLVSERHRHRWEFNNAYRAAFDEAGLIASGLAPDSSLVEIGELRGHPFMLGSQFHPELRSRPTTPHPLFREFVRAALGGRQESETVDRAAWQESTVGSTVA
jgi:CTP synthase